MEPKKPDFSGYATRYNIKCTDGAIIRPGAFSEQDGTKVPLVWRHDRKDPANYIGHVILHARPDGVYSEAYLNDSEQAKTVGELVRHKDVDSLSIFANQLKRAGADVLAGVIGEVSVVDMGANSGAKIDTVALVHLDGSVEDLQDEATIVFPGTIEHATKEAPMGIDNNENNNPNTDEELEHEAADATVVFESMNDQQKALVASLIATLDDEVEQSNNEGEEVGNRNLFEGKSEIEHAENFGKILDAAKAGKVDSLKNTYLEHAVNYGVEDLDILFPDFKDGNDGPEFIRRDMGWVNALWNGTNKGPFLRVKTVSADMTLDDARAKGYVKAALKEEMWFGLNSRQTDGTTIYIKSKLDEDDIEDLSGPGGYAIVGAIKREMRISLTEETARAALIGDGRPPAHPDKIREDKIRPVVKDDPFYTDVVRMSSPTPTAVQYEDTILANRWRYRGTGNPMAFVAESWLSMMLLQRETHSDNRRYRSVEELATALRVSEIHPVPQLEGFTMEDPEDDQELVSVPVILLNPNDYRVGSNSGGTVKMFDDFDIHYNQRYSLLETRLSGALRFFKRAQAVHVPLA